MKQQTLKPNFITFDKAWKLLHAKFPPPIIPNVTWLYRLARESPEILGVVRRNKIAKRGRGGAFLCDSNKVKAYVPYQTEKKH